MSFANANTFKKRRHSVLQRQERPDWFLLKEYNILYFIITEMAKYEGT